MKIHHVGYLVKKIDKAAEEFEKLGYIRRGDITVDTYRKVDILFLEKDGYVVELVSPNAPDSVVSGLIKTYKTRPTISAMKAQLSGKIWSGSPKTAMCRSISRRRRRLSETGKSSFS